MKQIKNIPSFFSHFFRAAQIFVLLFPSPLFAQLKQSESGDVQSNIIGASAITFLELLGFNTELGKNRVVFSPIGRLILFFFSILGLIFFALIVYGGFLWVSSKGDDEKVKNASSIIQNAVLGLIVVLASYFVVYFIISLFGNINAPTS